MLYTIYRGTVPVVENIRPTGTVTERLKGEDIANITFTSSFRIAFHVGDKITIYNKVYFLSAEPLCVKKNTREFQYTLAFVGLKYKLRNIQVFSYDNDQELTLPEFSIMGNAETCLDLIIANANRIDVGWSKGIVDSTEVKNITFSETNCLAAITQLSEEFELEFWVDPDQSIHLTERKPQSGYSLEYGKTKGLKSIQRNTLEGGSVVTRLYVKGSDKNIPKNYRSGQKNLRIDVPYLEENTNIYGILEHTETFEDVFPKYEGTVTAIDVNDPNRFVDASIDFDLNDYDTYGSTVLMNGIPVKVIFQTGQLAGYRLELLEAGGFNSNTKTFYLNKNKDEKDLEIPSTLLRPAVGDKYILEDLMMPTAYVMAAEHKLKTKALEYLQKNSRERLQYVVESDPFYFKAQNVNIPLGSTVRFKDLDFGLDEDIRVYAKSTSIQNPFEVTVELSETTNPSSITQTYYEQQEQQNTIVNQIKYNAELARRNYLFGREFHDNVFDGEGYFDVGNIKPLSIETKMLSLGSRLQQFGLPGINFSIVDNNKLTNTLGQIKHQTIDENGIRTWDIPANTINDISSNFNYIFLKCQRIGSVANFVVSEQPIRVDEEPDYYYFEVGYISSIIENYRKIKTTYGFAQLNPAELSIGRVSDPTGNNFIDLLQDKIAIKASLELTADSPAYGQITNTLEIGGVNLIKQTHELSSLEALWLTANCNVFDSTPFMVIEFYTNGGSAKFNVRDRLSTSLIIGQKYTLSWKERSSSEGGKYTVDIGTNVNATKTFTTEQNEQRRSLTFVHDNWINNYVEFKNVDLAGEIIELRDFKLEKGNVPTDFTIAPQDLDEELTNIQNDINDVYNNVNTLDNTFNNFASDGVFSIAEGVAINNQLNILANEKADITSRYNGLISNTFLKNPAKLNLTTSYNYYVQRHSNLTNYIIGAMADNIATPQEVNNVNLLFIEYKNGLSDLSTKFETAIASIQTEQLNSLDFGGRNLLLKSKYNKTFNTYGMLDSNNNSASTITSIKLEVGQQYTFSMSGRSEALSAGKYLRVILYCNDWSDQHSLISTSANDAVYSMTFIAQKSEFYYLDAYYFDSSQPREGTVTLNWVKLEKGNVATDWMPAPEDYQIQIDTQALNVLNLQDKTDFLTQSNIQGNAIATGTLLVGHEDGANGGITGYIDNILQGDSVSLWFGKPYEERNQAPFRVTQNGKIFLESKNNQNLPRGMTVEGEQIIFKDENNIVRRRISMFDFKNYSANGTLLWEVNETGFHSYIVQESWLGVLLLQTYIPYDENVSIVDLRDYFFADTLSIVVTPLLDGIKTLKKVSLSDPSTFQQYSAGNANASNLQYEGYKKTQVKTNNVDNGWYSPNYGQLGSKSGYNPMIEIHVELWYIKNGKITRTVIIEETV